MIEAMLYPEEATRTPQSGCYYRAEATVDGQHFTARSRNGAANALARTLVAAGIRDQEFRIQQNGHRGWLVWKSLHQAAKWTYTEGQNPLSRIRWVDPALRHAERSVWTGQIEAQTPCPATPIAAEPN